MNAKNGSAIVRITFMIIAVTAFGCTQNTVRTVPVSGVVTVDGVPLANGSVMFFNDDLDSGEKAIHGSTDEDGRYELLPGATPNLYRVVVKGFPGCRDLTLANLGDDGVDEGQQMAAAAARMQRTGHGGKKDAYRQTGLPAIYTSPQLTVLRIEIPDEGTTTADLHLTMKEPAKNSIATSESHSNVQ